MNTGLFWRHSRAFSVTPLDKNTLSLLTYQDKQIYLVGTSHISSKSADQVRDLIQTVKPDTVFVELCEERAQKIWTKILENRNSSKGTSNSTALAPITSEEWMDDLPFVKQFRDLMKRYLKIFELFGYVYGGEFYAAIEEVESKTKN